MIPTITFKTSELSIPDYFYFVLFSTKMHPIALICLSPLSIPEREASFPRVLESSNSSAEPNPILKSQESQSFWLLVVMPIFALE